MKNWTLKVVMMIGAVVAISACSKKGSNNAAVTPIGVAGACAIDATGACVGGIPYTASGSYSGQLMISNPQVAQQFLMENRLCHDQRHCLYVQSLNISMRVFRQSGGIVLRSNSTGWGNDQLRLDNARAYAHNGAMGFQMVVNNMYSIQQPMIYPPITSNVIQVVNTFTDGYGYMMNTTLIYRGVVIAQGMTHMSRSRPRYGYGGGVSGERPSGSAPAVLPYR